MKKIICITTLILSSFAQAHSDVPLKAEYGGTIKEAAAGHQLELVYGAEALTLYIKDHDGKKLSSEGASAEIIVQQNNSNTTVQLKPNKGNALTAKGDFSQLSGAVVIVKYTMKGEKLEQARLTLK
jgi:nitrogen fixation protein FixH